MEIKEIYERTNEISGEISNLIGKMKRINYRIAGDWSAETTIKIMDATAKLRQANERLSEFRIRVAKESEKREK